MRDNFVLPFCVRAKGKNQTSHLGIPAGYQQVRTRPTAIMPRSLSIFIFKQGSENSILIHTNRPNWNVFFF